MVSSMFEETVCDRSLLLLSNRDDAHALCSLQLFPALQRMSLPGSLSSHATGHKMEFLDPQIFFDASAQD